MTSRKKQQYNSRNTIMNSDNQNQQDQLIDALLHEQNRSDREQQIQAIQDALFHSVPAQIDKKSRVISWLWKIGLAAAAVLAIGYFQTDLHRPNQHAVHIPYQPKETTPPLAINDFPPKVADISNKSQESVSILGAVKNPGKVILPEGGLNVMTALASVGGLNATSDINKIEVIFNSGEKAVFSLSDIMIGEAGKIELKNGDQVIVGQNPFVGKYITVGGQVQKRGLFPYPLDGNLDIVAAITVAGGLTDIADGKLLLTRNGQTKTIDYKAIIERGEPSVMILPGDFIQARARSF
jgi:protein involved in polysaccharide export with SLBB domain